MPQHQPQNPALKLRYLTYKTKFHIHTKQQVEAGLFRQGVVNIRVDA
jgi:hypothetical protein